MSRHLLCTSSSRRLQRTPQSQLDSRFPGFQANSLFKNILPVNPSGRIFCGESFIFPFCFQYFRDISWEGGAMEVPPNAGLAPEDLGQSSVLVQRNHVGSSENSHFGLCSFASLVYGVGSFKKPKRMCCPRRGIPRPGSNIPVLWPGTDILQGTTCLPHPDLARSHTEASRYVRFAAQHIGVLKAFNPAYETMLPKVRIHCLLAVIGLGERGSKGRPDGRWSKYGYPG